MPDFEVALAKKVKFTRYEWSSKKAANRHICRPIRTFLRNQNAIDVSNSRKITDKCVKSIHRVSTFLWFLSLSNVIDVLKFAYKWPKGLKNGFFLQSVLPSGNGVILNSPLPHLPEKRARLMPPTDQRIMIYVRQETESAFTPLHLVPPTVPGLIRAIESKYKITASSIRYLYKKNRNDHVVKIDDDMIAYYSNEATFLMQVNVIFNLCFACKICMILWSK